MIPDHDVADVPFVTILAVGPHHKVVQLGDQVYALGRGRRLRSTESCPGRSRATFDRSPRGCDEWDECGGPVAILGFSNA